jgi:nucleoside-diphosphate-sugar epimerase
MLESLGRELRGARIFLTGGTGFLGSALVEAFSAANARDARLVVLTRQTIAPRDPAIESWRGDIEHFAFPQGEFSHVIHGANPVARDASIEPVILNGTARVLEFCDAQTRPRILYLSSGAVYAPSDRAIAEDFPLAQAKPGYAHAKQIAEKMCVDVSATIARGFSFLGPRVPLDGSFAAGNFIRDLLLNRPIRVAGNGKAVRSYLYTADLAEWLWTILLRGKPGRAYNVGSDQPLIIRELAKKIAAAGALPVEIRGDSSAGESHYVPSIERARRELGLEVKVPLDEAIRRTIEWRRRERALSLGGASTRPW